MRLHCDFPPAKGGPLKGNQMRYVSEHGEKIVKSALQHLNAKGIEFLHEHPFFGDDAEQFPKTVALVKDLAMRVSTGEITPDDADKLAVQSMDAECQEHLTQSPLGQLLAGLSQRLAN